MINLTFDEITQEAELADKNPTDLQKEKGNYKMGHVTIKGFKISIENAKGSYRRYKDENGNEGVNQMKCHYGYFRNSKGHDGDHVDVFIGDNLDFTSIFVIDQKYPDGGFDESKVMLGFSDKDEAKSAYLSNYDKNWNGFMGITEVSVDVFKKWLYRKRKQRKPFGEYVKIIAHKLNEMKLHEEEYNQVIKLGTIDDNKTMMKIAHRFYVMGIDYQIDGNDIFISVEQDRNDNHYVDDVIKIAKKVFNDCVKPKTGNYRLAENELKWVLDECVKRLINESVFNDALFAIVKAQAKRMAFRKIKKAFLSKLGKDTYHPKSKFDKCVLKICDSKNYTNEKECTNILLNAIDMIMDKECKKPGMTEYEMFSLINSVLENYI